MKRGVRRRKRGASQRRGDHKQRREIQARGTVGLPWSSAVVKRPSLFSSDQMRKSVSWLNTLVSLSQNLSWRWLPLTWRHYPNSQPIHLSRGIFTTLQVRLQKPCLPLNHKQAADYLAQALNPKGQRRGGEVWHFSAQTRNAASCLGPSTIAQGVNASGISSSNTIVGGLISSLYNAQNSNGQQQRKGILCNS